MQQRSATAQIQNLARSADLGRAVSVTVPYRSGTGSLLPAFVQEGGSIPVSTASFDAVVLSRYKMGIISLATEGLLETSSIPDTIEDFILDDLASDLDQFVLNSTSD